MCRSDRGLAVTNDIHLPGIMMATFILRTRKGINGFKARNPRIANQDWQF